MVPRPKNPYILCLLISISKKDFQNIQNELEIISTKLSTYSTFNKVYPGFGGFLPWFQIDNSSQGIIVPSTNWENKVPALDNGELFWAIYALKSALTEKGIANDVVNALETQLNIMSKYGQLIFYGCEGKIRWTSQIKDNSLSPDDPNQLYSG